MNDSSPQNPPIASLHDLLYRQMPQVRVTIWLMVANGLVFLAMLGSGAGWWHTPNQVQLSWGANFGPATQDGEWWRLGSAMFLHFGVLHLAMNLWALWDAGRLVERMYGRIRFALIYFLSGIAGNLLSLVVHQGHAVSGGASGAIFGTLGALLACMWRERRDLHPTDFRWLFWGASGFAIATLVFGLLIPGIDNAAHIGGFVAGLITSTALARALTPAPTISRRSRVIATLLGLLALTLLIQQVPRPAYRWSEEHAARKEIGEFIRDEALIREAWQDIAEESRRRGTSFEALAGRIDTDIADRYEESFENLSQLSDNPNLPSFATLERLRHYIELRRDASRSLAEGLRTGDSTKIREAMTLEKKSREFKGPMANPPDKATK